MSALLLLIQLLLKRIKTRKRKEVKQRETARLRMRHHRNPDNKAAN